MILARAGGRGSRSEGPDLTSLDERLGLLLIVRIGMVGIVVLGAVFASSQVGFTVTQIGPVSAGYLSLAAAAEWYRRSRFRGRMSLHRAILPLDAVYLAIVTAPGGGPRSQLVVLFAVQLIAVTLLASERAGIRMALWDSFLLIMIPTLSLSGRIGSMLGVRLVAAPPAGDTALAIMGFWVVALCTAFFSSVSERELRSSKAELQALTQMTARLEGVQNEAEILAVFLRTVVGSFPVRRGALWWTQGLRPEGLSLDALGDRVRSVTVEGHGKPDRITGQAWARREALLVRQLDADLDPVAVGLLPGARNVIVLPLQIDSQDSGAVLLEHGGHPLLARMPRRTLDMLTQFTAHVALSLRNARLLAERERLAALDGLTGLSNRRDFDQFLTREVNRADRTGEPLSLVVFDVDYFKQVNDSRGHLAGDEVLRALGQVLAGSIREMDLAARYGGEEFAMVLPRCDQADAVLVVSRVTASMRRRDDLTGITISSGVATMPVNASSGLTLVAAADEALYESKRAGRDRSTVSERHAISERHESSDRANFRGRTLSGREILSGPNSAPEPKPGSGKESGRPASAWQAGSVPSLFEDLTWRGLVHQVTDRETLPGRIDRGGLVLYIGFDPTADSLHVGHLQQLCLLRRFQEAGHRPIALVGGGTGMIGDPSGKGEERNLLSREQLDANRAGVAAQIWRLLDLEAGAGASGGPGAILVDNAEWLGTTPLLDFLRDVGKLFSVNEMIRKDSVRARLEGREQFLSFTEFSYMLLQAWDFLQLYDRYGCELQLGGSDQWGNITEGIDLIRRRRAVPAFGLTSPLVTKADGTKFGKTESGSVWLDPARTSPYAFFQFWVRTGDAEVGSFLRRFTFLPRDRIEELDRATDSEPGRRQAQRALAFEVTALVHGDDEARRAEQAAAVLFTPGIAGLDQRTLESALADAPTTLVPQSAIEGGLTVVDALIKSDLAASRREARRLLTDDAVLVNGTRIAEDRPLAPADALHGRWVVLRRGRTRQAVLVVGDG